MTAEAGIASAGRQTGAPEEGGAAAAAMIAQEFNLVTTGQHSSLPTTARA
ncbi:MAG: hypothetical protein ABI809_07555 [Caldimonas sp.]